MKPIEEGCLAVIIKAISGVGDEVTVGKFLGKTIPEFHPDSDRRWEVDRSMETSFGRRVYHLGESQLMRIDGGEFEEEQEEELVLLEDK